ncbi:copper-binding protein [Solibacillus sp. R5-41]|uniref:plastocyanin/azurin family copper-binding protein n=1 Tax=Solibacillus sp. R5-41 TaxID=2048654 RepID=UPI000C129599|nr:plastocyanin/azurin family copper-binding protein [Solibacillus sp. R5-41]ATP42128.1 copper-binding protein [Solibacillus sp. R5-41]
MKKAFTANKKGGGLLGNYQLFILISLVLLTIVVVAMGIIWRKKFRTMHGMIISMFFGMNVGLTVGVLFGVTYQGNLFHSTILSLAIGVLAGSVCGLCFGLLSVLEGLMAGLMGGMMGAMLGEMIRVEQSFSLIQLFLFLTGCTIFIMGVLKNPKNAQVTTKRWILKPIVLSILLSVYIIVGNSLAENFENFSSADSLNGHHPPSYTSTDDTAAEKQVIVIEADEMKYSTNQIVVEKNRTVHLTFSNRDQIDHYVEINAPVLPIDNESIHHQGTEYNRTLLHAEPNNTVTSTFTPTEPGTYEFVCTVPGHKESGMVGRLIVR